MPLPAIVKTLRDALDRLCPPSGGEALVLAVSGGADSMALMHGMALLNHEQQQSWSLRVAHLNHLIRGDDADRDAEFVAEQSAGLVLPCVVERCDVPELARAQKMSLEQAARSARYAFLERVARDCGATFVATAHHADDQVETVLANVLTGAGLHGLRGMRPIRPMSRGSRVKLIRPLLAARREELRAFLLDRDVTWRHDHTNDNQRHLRNKIRHGVLPMLERDINPQVGAAILRLAEQAARIEDLIEEPVRRATCEMTTADRDDRLVLLVDSLSDLPVLAQTELLRLTVLRLAETDSEPHDSIARELGLEQLDRLVDLIRRNESGREVHLPGGIVAAREYDRLVFRRGDRAAPFRLERERSLACPGLTELSESGWRLRTVVRERAPDETSIADERTAGLHESVDFDAVVQPLNVRPPRPGDTFRPLGAPGGKKIARYFIDAKVPRDERDRVLLVCDQTGPVWLVGHRIDHRVRVTPETRRVLDMHAEML